MSDPASHDDEYGGLYTVAEARRALRCGTTTIYKLAREKRLELVRIGKRRTHVTGRSIKAVIEQGLRGNAA
jgi:excisionase family DNA binding protein